MAQSAEAEEAATAMHLVECWETRGKMEEDERETGKMISGVPPPLARSLGRSLGLSERRSERRHAMQRYGGTMQQVARRPEILSHRFASSDWREDREQG